MNTFPDLIVFDLDFTLWPFWVDTHVKPPFRNHTISGKVVDRDDKEVKHYPDVPRILSELYSRGVRLAIASRTTCTREALDLVKLFGWDKYFTYAEIYPGSKTRHFGKFSELSGIPLARMLFFDDERRNISELSAAGVTSILVEGGMSMTVLQQGLTAYAQRYPQNQQSHYDQQACYGRMPFQQQQSYYGPVPPQRSFYDQMQEAAYYGHVLERSYYGYYGYGPAAQWPANQISYPMPYQNMHYRHGGRPFY